VRIKAFSFVSRYILKIINDLLSNQIFICTGISWFVAQGLKIIILIIKKNHKLKAKDFIIKAVFGTGAMPSSHSATVTTATVSAGIVNGFDSSIFAIMSLVMLIVIRDATGVRLSAGKQVEVLNELIARENATSEDSIKKLKAVNGHTPLECFVGILIGLVVSLGFFKFSFQTI